MVGLDIRIPLVQLQIVLRAQQCLQLKVILGHPSGDDHVPSITVRPLTSLILMPPQATSCFTGRVYFLLLYWLKKHLEVKIKHL